MKRIIQAAAAFALLSLAACGGGSENPDQPTAKERQQLDETARKQDQEQKEQTFDTSADSLVINESAAEPPENGAAPVDAPVTNATAGEAPAQR